MRLLEKLNTPRAVVAVLAIFLVVDGFLLYRYRADDEAARPNNGEKGGALEARTAEPTEETRSGAVSTAEPTEATRSGAVSTAEPTEETRSGAVSTAEAAAYSPVTAEAAAYSPVTAEAAEPEPTGAPPSGAVSTAEAAAYYSPVTAAAPTYREPISEPPQYGADLPASPQGATFYEWWWFTY